MIKTTGHNIISVEVDVRLNMYVLYGLITYEVEVESATKTHRDAVDDSLFRKCNPGYN